VVLFDLDGTLADTAPDLANALNRTLQNHGKAPLTLEQIRPAVSHGAAALIRLGFGLQPDDDQFEPLRQELIGYYSEDLSSETTLFPGMDKVLEQLEECGLRWGIVTNKPARLTDPLMEQMGMDQRAACIVSGDTTANSKPHPEPILHACELAGGTPQQCLYVGDAKRDIEAGHNAGTQTLVALFGYLGEEDHPETWQADAQIEQPSGILEWLGIAD
jgi:phosphoglycolate phosphatase